jgi:hypothetical protein
MRPPIINPAVERRRAADSARRINCIAFLAQVCFTDETRHPGGRTHSPT